MGPTVKAGYFSQENEYLDPEQKVIDYIRDTAEYVQTEEGSISASMMLERFLFDGALQHSLIGKLSGGEKRRLYLLKVLMEAPNILILDEPTNDLDIQTLASPRSGCSRPMMIFIIVVLPQPFGPMNPIRSFFRKA